MRRDAKNRKVAVICTSVVLVAIATGLFIPGPVMDHRTSVLLLRRGVGCPHGQRHLGIPDHHLRTQRTPRGSRTVHRCRMAISGCAMQAVFRNPLASPCILGLPSGASVGAAVSMLITTPFIPAVLNTPVMAFVSCFGTMALVYSMSRVRGMVKTETLILSGVAVSSLLSALVSFLTFIAGDKLEGIVFWSMGTWEVRNGGDPGHTVTQLMR